MTGKITNMKTETENQPRIALLGTLPPIRALSSYCYELTQALVPHFKIEFISFKSIYPAFLYPGGDPKDDHTYPEIDSANLNVRRNLTWYNPFSWLYDALLTSRTELLHAQWWSLPLFPVHLTICSIFKIRKKPIVFTVHNVLPHDKSSLYETLSRLLFRFGSHFIVHTTTGRRQMIEHYQIPPERISVIPHGTLDFHVNHHADRQELRKKMGIDSQEKIILLFGAIRPYKGIDVAIKALPEIIAQIPEARLLIAGKLWEDWQPYERLISQLQLQEHVILHLEYIPSDQVHTFFEVADLTIFPYCQFDSQSGAGATAISFQKPMIVSRVGGLPELVQDTRFVIEPEDCKALAQAVSICLDDPALLEQMSRQTQAVSQQLSWSDIAEKTRMVYRNLLIGKPSH
jgi:glycosyltransferase involved in cell wall biosynthesis